MGALKIFGVPFFLDKFLRGDFYGGFLGGGWCPPACPPARPPAPVGSGRFDKNCLVKMCRTAIQRLI